ncbi:hypothetical protein ACTFIW_000644 [Dictyostelium discoideum]
MDIIMKENLYCYNSKKRNLTICEELPYDILLYILSYLTPTELCCLSRVCYSFRVLAEDDWIWRGFYPMIRFNFCYHFQLNEFPKLLNTQQCKQVYIQELQTIKSVSQFIGTWHEQWCDVQVLNSTKVSFNGLNFIVEYTKNKFEAEFISFNGQSLKFKLTGGDSGWSFIYTLTLNNNNNNNQNNNQNNNNNQHKLNNNNNINNNNNNNSSNGMKIHLQQDDQNLQQDSLQLHVLRIHDNIEFTGMFTSSKSESNSPPPHFRNKNNYKLFLMKQEIQQLQQISSTAITSSSNEIFNTNNNDNNNNNSHDNNNNNNNNSNSSCDSRRHTRIYAY